MDATGGDLDSIRQQLLAKRGAATRSLTGGYSTDAQKKRGGMDELAALVAKRRADAIKISTITLRDNLVKNLESTIQEQMREYPQMEGRYFVGFIMGDNPSVEVVDIETAASMVTDEEESDAKEIMRNNPVGYFQPDDFTLKTPEDEAFQSFKRRLGNYLKENAKVIRYLQSHPEEIGSLDEFVKQP